MQYCIKAFSIYKALQLYLLKRGQRYWEQVERDIVSIVIWELSLILLVVAEIGEIKYMTSDKYMFWTTRGRHMPLTGNYSGNINYIESDSNVLTDKGR